MTVTVFELGNQFCILARIYSLHHAIGSAKNVIDVLNSCPFTRLVVDLNLSRAYLSGLCALVVRDNLDFFDNADARTHLQETLVVNVELIIQGHFVKCYEVVKLRLIVVVELYKKLLQEFIRQSLLLFRLYCSPIFGSLLDLLASFLL